MSSEVLEPFTKNELKKLLDSKSIDVIKYFIKKSLFSQPEVLPTQTVRAVEIPKQHLLLVYIASKCKFLFSWLQSKFTKYKKCIC
jgi:hypothetical protein